MRPTDNHVGFGDLCVFHNSSFGAVRLDSLELWSHALFLCDLGHFLKKYVHILREENENIVSDEVHNNATSTRLLFLAERLPLACPAQLLG